MNQSDLLKEIHKDLKGKGLVTRVDQTKEIFESVIDNINNEIIKGKRVVISNFGTLNTKLTTKNTFKAGETVKVWILSFKASTYLKKAINGN